jgi:hypothetical protein
MRRVRERMTISPELRTEIVDNDQKDVRPVENLRRSHPAQRSQKARKHTRDCYGTELHAAILVVMSYPLKP